MSAGLPPYQFLWPDEERGPWYVCLIFTDIGGVAEVTGVVLRSHHDPDDLADTLMRPRVEQGKLRPRPAPLTATLLRDLRLGEQVRRARKELRAFLSDWAEKVEVRMRAIYETKVQEGTISRVPERFEAESATREETARQQFEHLSRSDPLRKPGPKVNLKRLQRVGEVVTRAKTEGRPTGLAVADELELSEDRASALISQAREYGFLPLTNRGKAREAATTKREESR